MHRPRLLTQEVRRTRAIVGVFVRHGLGDLVSHLNLPWAARRATRLGRAEASEVGRAVRFRQALEELGPTFIKFGQALSIRSDLLPAGLATELGTLQDAAPPLPASVITAVVEAELKAPLATVFREFDPTPIGSASIAQVHAATLPDGTRVAVKVRRPGIRDVIESDLAVLHAIAVSAERHWADAELFAPTALVAQFARTIRLEQDFTREGRVIERFAHNFRDSATIVIPRVHWACTSRAVLTLDYIDGIKVSQVDALRRHGSDPGLVARRGADAILQQVLEDGLFHADPHPGNLLVLPGSVIALLDYGIVGHLTEPARDRLTELIMAVGTRDATRLAPLLLALGEPLVPPDPPALEQDLVELVDTYAGARLQDLSLAQVWSDIASVIGRHRIKLPSDLMLLVKTLITMEAVGLRLDPGFRMIEHATPYVQRLLREHWSPRRAVDRLGRASRDLGEVMHDVPRDLQALLGQARSGRLAVHVRQDDVKQLARALDQASRRLGASVLAAMVLLSVVLVGLTTGLVDARAAAVGVIGGGLLLVWLVVIAMRSAPGERTRDSRWT